MTNDRKAGAKRVRTVMFVDDAVAFGGSLLVSLMIARYLDPTRYRAIIVSAVDEESVRHHLGEGVEYRRVTQGYNYLDRARFRERFGESPALPIRAVRYALHQLRRLTNLPYWLRLGWIILTEPVDVIHNSNGKVFPYLAMFGRGLVGTVQGLPTSPYTRAGQAALSRYGAVITISRAAHKAYLNCGGDEAIAHLIPNPFDPVPIPDGFDEKARAEFGLPPDAVVFGVVGRVLPWKGQKEFVIAADRVLARAPDAVAVVVGDAADGAGDYFEEIKRLADASPHGDRIRFLGHVSDMRLVYSTLDVAVHTSIRPEPFGLVITEAMGYEIPIVAANAGGPLDIIEDGVDGRLVDPTDAEALSSAIIGLIEDTEERARMAAAGQKKVLAKYHAQQYTERVQDLYDSAVELARGGASTNSTRSRAGE